MEKIAVGTFTCLSCEKRPRCMSIWFSYNTSKSGDEQINMKETCGLCVKEMQNNIYCNIALSSLVGE